MMAPRRSRGPGHTGPCSGAEYWQPGKLINRHTWSLAWSRRGEAGWGCWRCLEWWEADVCVVPTLDSSSLNIVSCTARLVSYNLEFRITTGKRINWIIRPLSTPVAVNCSFNCWINFRFLHCILENDEKEIVKSARKLSNNSTLTTAEWMVTVRAISVRNSRQMQFLTSKWIVPIDLSESKSAVTLCQFSGEAEVFHKSAPLVTHSDSNATSPRWHPTRKPVAEWGRERAVSSSRTPGSIAGREVCPAPAPHNADSEPGPGNMEAIESIDR